MKKEIYNIIKKAPKKQRTLEAIAKKIHLRSGEDFKVLTKNLDSLTKEGLIYRDKFGVYQVLKNNDTLIKGKMDLKTDGYGFIIVEDSDMPDIFIPRNKTLSAMNGDICLVKITNRKSKIKIEGQVEKVLERNITHIVGEYFDGEIFPKETRDDIAFKLIKEDQYKVKNNQLIKAKIVNYSHNYYKDCELTEVIGDVDMDGIEVLEVIHKYDLIHKFSESEIAAAKSVEQTVKANDLVGRVDLRKASIFTIDSESTKDIDDAISIEKINDNYLLAVHIADVSHYVLEDTILDKSAFERGTSVYLADSVIPMLPKELSNGICSLNPGVDRLTITCQMEITKKGEVVNYDIYPSVINSKYKMTYTNVNKMLLGEKEVIAGFKDIYPDILLMEELQKILFTIREKMGSIDFETLEPKLIFGPNGKLDDIVIKERAMAERLIEEFMLVANQVVATHVYNLNLPFIYRIHELPNSEKIDHVFEFVKNLGYDIESSDYSQENLQSILKRVENTTYDKVVTTLLLRSMAKAKYARENEGHYGLAFDYYTHFTSPIRRYPDLIVHRYLRKYLFNNDKTFSQATIKRLDEIAKQASNTEKIAMTCEREVLDIKKAEYMEKHINQEFVGVIGSILKFGMFIELPNTIEGLVHISTLKERFVYDEKNLSLKSLESDKEYNIGQEVKIKVVKVNKLLGQIDFIFI